MKDAKTLLYYCHPCWDQRLKDHAAAVLAAQSAAAGTVSASPSRSAISEVAARTESRPPMVASAPAAVENSDSKSAVTDAPLTERPPRRGTPAWQFAAISASIVVVLAGVAGYVVLHKQPVVKTAVVEPKPAPTAKPAAAPVTADSIPTPATDLRPPTGGDFPAPHAPAAPAPDASPAPGANANADPPAAPAPPDSGRSSPGVPPPPAIPEPAPAMAGSVGQITYALHTPLQADLCTWDDLLFTADGKTLAGLKGMTVSDGMGGTARLSTLYIWNTFTGGLDKSHLISSPMRTIHFSPDESEILCSPAPDAPWHVYPQLAQDTGLVPVKGEPPPWRRRNSVFYSGDRVFIFDLHFLDGRIAGATGKGIIEWDRANQPAAAAQPGQPGQGGRTATARGGRGTGGRVFPQGDPRNRGLDPGTKVLETNWQYCAAFSADYSTCAAFNGDELEVWDIATKNRRCTISDPGLGGLAPLHLKLSSDGSRLCALYCSRNHGGVDANRAFIADTQTGRIISFLSVPNGAVLSVDITPNGKFAVTGGSPKTACVWDAETGACLARHDELYLPVSAVAISPDGALVAEAFGEGSARIWDTSQICHAPAPSFSPPPPEQCLAQGSLPVIFQCGTQALSGNLLLLTSSRLVVTMPGIAPGAPPRTAVYLADGSVSSVQTKDHAHTWSYDSAARQFVGTSLGEPAPESPPQTRDVSHDQEEAFLLFRMQHWLYSAQALARRPQDDLAIQKFKTQVQQCRDYVQAHAFAPALTDICDALVKLVDEGGKETVNQIALIGEAARDARKLADDRRQAAEQRLLRIVSGAAMIVVGSDEVELGRERIGNTIHVYEQQLSPELAAAGADTIIQAQIDSMHNAAVLQQLQASQNADMKNEFAKSAQNQSDLCDSTQRMIDAALSTRSAGLGLPAAPNPSTRAEADSQTKLFLDLLAKRATAATAVYGATEPYTQSDLLLCRCGAAGGSPTSTDAIAVTAHALKDLFRLVPAGPMYDTDRAEFLTEAAAMALAAADKESGSRNWQRSYSINAAFAVDCLRLALSYEPADPTGQLRETLAFALCQSGRPAEGVTLACQIEPLRAGSPLFRVSFARALAALGRNQDAVDQIEIAVDRLGFKDLVGLAKLEGLPRSDPRFKHAVEIDLSFRLESSRLLPASGFTLQNNSSFALDDMVVEVTYPSGKSASHTMTARIPVLESQDQIHIDYEPGFPCKDYQGTEIHARLVKSLEGPGPIKIQIPADNAPPVRGNLNPAQRGRQAGK